AAARRAASDEEPPPRPAPTPAPDGGPPRICVDAGHGGSDPGALGFGLEEADLVLDIALRLGDLLEADTLDPAGGGEWEVLLTRTDDSFVSLQQRVDLANAWPADRFVSVHANAFFDPAANGTETYCFLEGTTAASMRDRIHEEMLAAWGLTDRGTKTAGFFVLVNTAMPASLSETGFVTSPIDVQKLSDPDERQRMALAHLFALQRHYGLGPYEPSGGGGAGVLKGILYDAAAGTGAPIADATVALADGAFTVTSASGYFEFALPPGTYDFAATAPGFAAGGAQETVASGDVWESLGLASATTATLALDPLPPAGSLASLTILAASGEPAWLAYAPTPGLPLFDLGATGVLWPALAELVLAPLGAVPGTGVLTVPYFAPSVPGTRVHVQGLVGAGGGFLLTNGAALEAQ
ncbi:MAG: N-acetylmuramoyl-L-alanine amidase, partial [Planctomycetota bacterium]